MIQNIKSLRHPSLSKIMAQQFHWILHLVSIAPITRAKHCSATRSYSETATKQKVIKQTRKKISKIESLINLHNFIKFNTKKLFNRTTNISFLGSMFLQFPCGTKQTNTYIIQFHMLLYTLLLLYVYLHPRSLILGENQDEIIS